MLNRPAWTLGCMLFAEFFILGMLIFFEKPFRVFFLPWSLIIGFGYWMNLESASITKFLGFTTFGMLRVYLLTCVGICSFYICERIKKITFSKDGKVFLTCCEVIGFVCCILISCFRATRNYQFCCNSDVCYCSFVFWPNMYSKISHFSRCIVFFGRVFSLHLFVT